MADYIKLNSPIIFDMAIYISLDLMESYEVIINEDETAFIAMHIGAEIERQNKTNRRSRLFCCALIIIHCVLIF